MQQLILDPMIRMLISNVYEINGEKIYKKNIVRIPLRLGQDPSQNQYYLIQAQTN